MTTEVTTKAPRVRNPNKNIDAAMKNLNNAESGVVAVAALLSKSDTSWVNEAAAARMRKALANIAKMTAHATEKLEEAASAPAAPEVQLEDAAQ
jgi:oligoribonuclease (3'-5' exoribonuclease)